MPGSHMSRIIGKRPLTAVVLSSIAYTAADGFRRLACVCTISGRIVSWPGVSFLAIVAMCCLMPDPAISQVVGQSARSLRLDGGKLAQAAVVIKDGRIAAEHFRDGAEFIRAIVEFSEEPLSSIWKTADKRSAFAARERRIDEQHRRFMADIRRIDDSRASKQGATEILFEYRRVFNGVAVRASRSILDRLRGLAYVRRVSEDRIFSTTDATTSALVGAVRTRIELGLTGRGVLLAILDSGIDYTHPDFGGGIGAGYRVVGGYDFANGDDDPMDDNGHGTHVAGVAAGGSETVPGIAPGVRLLAVKVLNSAGFGSESVIIAGLEYALDPDGDPSTDDGADILNLSFGGEGHPDDPIASAVDRIVEAGVVCVVSAGNSGRYHSVASPGVASRALTVGASDNSDAIAPFSSRGPAQTSFSVKPEIVAPGVLVVAPLLGGGHRQQSGTSSAAPHVAGSAALLLELHPEWTPARVKAALVSTAHDIGEDVWTQGAGRLDVYAAANSSLDVSSAVLNFGDIDSRPEVWTDDREVTVRSTASTEMRVKIEQTRPLPSGVSLSVNPAVFTLPPGAEQSVNVHLEVINSLLDFTGLPPGTATVLEISSLSDTLRVPVSAVKAHSVAFNLDRDPLYLFLLGDSRSYILVPGASGRSIIDPDTYDIVGLFHLEPDGVSPARRAIVTRRGVEVSGRTIVDLHSEEATQSIGVYLKTEDGGVLTPEFDAEVIQIDGTGFSMLLLGDPAYSELTFSPDDTGFTVDHVFAKTGLETDPDYYVPIRIDPKAGAGSAANDPDAFTKLDFSFYAGDGVVEIAASDVVIQKDGTLVQLIGSDAPANRMSAPFTRQVYLGPVPDSTFQFIAYKFDAYDTSDGSDPDLNGLSNLLYRGGILRIIDGTIQLARTDNGPTIHELSGDHLNVRYGGHLPFWRGEMIEFTESRIYYRRPPYFYSSYLEARKELTTYDIRSLNDSEDTSSGSIVNFRDAGLNRTILFSQGANVLTWKWYGYRIDGLQGEATVGLWFDTSVLGRAPAYLSYLAVRSDGEPTFVLEPGAVNELDIEVQYDVDVRAYLRPLQSTSWREFSTQKLEQTTHRASIPGDLEPGFHSLRITLLSDDGALLDYTAEPAFRWLRKDVAANRRPTSFGLQTPGDGEQLVSRPGQAIGFEWEASSDPDPEDVLRYRFSLSGPGMDTTIVLRGKNALHVSGTSTMAAGATYNWSVIATDGYAEVAATKEFTFVMGGTGTGIPDSAEIRGETRITAQYPNPFRDSATIDYYQAWPGKAQFDVFDVTGRRLGRIETGMQLPGAHKIVWDARGLPGGIYLGRLRVAGKVMVRRLVKI